MVTVDHMFELWLVPEVTRRGWDPGVDKVRPDNPNRVVVLLLKPVASPGSVCIATVRLQEVTGPTPQARRQRQEPGPARSTSKSRHNGLRL
jgi:hypothetical protein